MSRGAPRRAAGALVAMAFALLGAERRAQGDELVMLPGRDGALGAWLAAGPLRPTGQKGRFLPIDAPIADAPDAALRVDKGVEVAPGKPLRLVASPAHRLDLVDLLAAPQTEAFALAAAVLRARARAELLLVLGADDGVAVTLDGKALYARDPSRPSGHDDDVVPFEIDPGDHRIVLRLHQHTGRWELRARLVGSRDLLPPRDVAVVLPGASAADAEDLARRMVAPRLELEPFADRYRPRLVVSSPGGLPAGVPLPVRVRATFVRPSAPAVDLWEVDAGRLPLTPLSTTDYDVALPEIAASELLDEAPGAQVDFHVTVGAHATEFVRPVLSVVRKTIGRVDAALGRLTAERRGAVTDPDVLAATLRHGRDRLADLVSSGDRDTTATAQEAVELGRLLDALEAGADPLLAVRGPVRLAYDSPLDGRPRPFGLYVPPSFAPGSAKRWPLVVVLHGLNGKPMQMIRWFFGRDDPGQTSAWEDRHVGALPELDAFVVSPSGFGNLGYREAGEVDVVTVRDWAARVLPIDPARVYVTGPSMGGIGAGAVALRFPDRFAAAAPLCGYHSYFLRGDMAGKRRRPWEQSLAEMFSNAQWAENGLHTPMFIVHGTRDLPEENSGVLIDRYKQLGYAIEDEHPDEGHQVWQKTYEGFKAYRWLARYRRDPEPKRVVLKTLSSRYADSAWVHVEKLARELSWGTVTARVAGRARVEVVTSGVEALRLDRPSSRLDARSRLQVGIDATKLDFGPDEPVELVLERGRWARGRPARGAAPAKRRGLAGPVHDAFLEPLVFVYGTTEPAMTAATLEVARALAEPGGGVEARWPVVADRDLDERIAATHALFLVGDARSNAYVAAIEPGLPIRIRDGAVVVGRERIAGNELGALFIYPNPRHPDRYVVVLEGVGVAGLRRGLSLPRLVPDFVVYDEGVAGARGQLVLGGATVRAAGFFERDWSLPADIADPLDGRRARTP